MSVSEERLAERVLARLRETDLERYGLKARLIGKALTLQGIVDVLADKIRAGVIASQTPGVTRVENAITVCTNGGIDDEDVALEVAEELAGNPAGLPVGAEIRGGRVRLVGHVPAVAAAKRAVEAASKARGVRAVSSRLALTPEAVVDDASLVNAVQEALADLFGVNARRLRVSARRGKVMLAGEVSERETIARIERIVSAVPGVRAVENTLGTTMETHDRILANTLARIGANPYLHGAALRFAIRQGRLVVEGEVQGLEAKRALEKVLRETLAEFRLELRGLDNRSRIV